MKFKDFRRKCHRNIAIKIQKIAEIPFYLIWRTQCIDIDFQTIFWLVSREFTKKSYTIGDSARKKAKHISNFVRGSYHGLNIPTFQLSYIREFETNFQSWSVNMIDIYQTTESKAKTIQ